MKVCSTVNVVIIPVSTDFIGGKKFHLLAYIMEQLFDASAGEVVQLGTRIVYQYQTINKI